MLDTESQSLSKGNDHAIADRATLVRNDVKTLVPQYLSALVPSKKAAFTKPSRGTSDSERRTIINGNRVFRFDCERCRLTRGAAFTLAEVLITLGIIGVVASLTIPNVVNNNTEKKKIVKLKKVYSQLTSVHEQILSDKGLVNIKDYLAKYPGMYDPDSHVAFRDLYKPYFKVVSASTDHAPYTLSVGPTYRINFAGSQGISIPSDSHSMFVTNDGTVYIFRLLPNSCEKYFGSYADKIPICGEIFVDLFPNPKSFTKPSAKNAPVRTEGKDIFLFHVTKDGIIPSGINGDMSDCYSMGFSCTQWVLLNENMDYLHCKDLDWNGKHKCD